MRSSRLSRAFLPIREITALLVISGLLVSTPGFAQAVAPSPAAPTPETEAAVSADPEPLVERISAEEAGYAIKPMEELEQMVGPVALYPDELLAQILPAAASPLDLVKAHQLLEGEPDLKEPPADAVENWDPAVVSLLQFKDVVAMMAEDIAWTTALGEAVYFQEEEIYDAIQLVRSKADANGLLAENEHQVYVKDAEVIRIEPSDPEVIYVPQYDPQVIYVEQAKRGPDPVLTFVTGVAVIWGLSWAFDWNRRKCVHHHHWSQPWHHHRYHSYYGRPYYNNGRPLPRPPSYRPPSRPPRPPGWKPPGQRPPAYRPPRPTQPIYQPPGNKPGRPGAKPPGGPDGWRPTKPPGANRPNRPGSGRPTQLPATKPGKPTQLPTKPTTRPVVPTKPTTRPVAPTKPTTRPVAPTKPTTRPVAPTKPTTRPVAPTKPTTRPVAPTKPTTRPVAPTKPTTRPAPTKRPVPTKPAARPAPTKRPAARPAPSKPAGRPAPSKPAPKSTPRTR